MTSTTPTTSTTPSADSPITAAIDALPSREADLLRLFLLPRAAGCALANLLHGAVRERSRLRGIRVTIDALAALSEADINAGLELCDHASADIAAERPRALMRALRRALVDVQQRKTSIS